MLPLPATGAGGSIRKTRAALGGGSGQSPLEASTVVGHRLDQGLNMRACTFLIAATLASGAASAGAYLKRPRASPVRKSPPR